MTQPSTIRLEKQGNNLALEILAVPLFVLACLLWALFALLAAITPSPQKQAEKPPEKNRSSRQRDLQRFLLHHVDPKTQQRCDFGIDYRI